jgi:ZIP family zinc transporter
VRAFAGGILAYIALEIGAEVAEYVERLAKWETFGLFLRDAVLTTAVFAGVFLLLSRVERRATARGMPQSLLTAFIAALAYGVHNVGEGFAIAGD